MSSRLQPTSYTTSGTRIPEGDLRAEIDRLRAELEVSQETLRAIRSGEVDALIVDGQDESKVLTLGPAEQTYQLIVNQVLHPTALLAPDGRILQTNASFARLAQKDQAVLHDMHIQQLIYPTSQKSLETLLDEGARREIERDLILKSGEGLRVPVCFSVRPLKENPTGLCLLLTDLTVERLRDKIISEELLAQSVLEQVADAVIVCDADGRIVRASQAVEDLLGADPMFAYFDDVMALNTLGENGVWDALSFQAIVGTPDMRAREVVFASDTRQAHLLLSAGFLYDTSGGLRGAVITLTDITDRKRVEQALELADRRKNEFLAILAHELRNPLAPISNSISILSMNLPAEVQSQALQMMDRQVKQMVRLVDDLMDVARITRGKIELKLEPLSLAEVLKTAIETSEPQIAQFQHRLAVTLPEAGARVQGDFTRLTQVFANLLNNAAKYTESGGDITVATTFAGAEATVTITDTGLGIRPEMLERIFDMFAQVDDSLERAHGGLGVGLTLVRNLVDMHGGRISASSAGLGKGSTFSVTLPLLSAAEPTGPQDEPEAQAAPAGALRVLIVEDNEALAKTTGWLVEALGYDYRLAHNGKDAVDIAAEYRPQVVMMDIGLPGMNGYDLCRLMRAEPHLADTIFIAQTGWGQSEHRQMAQEAGFHHHMVKPIDFAKLQETLADIKA